MKGLFYSMLRQRYFAFILPVFLLTATTVLAQTGPVIGNQPTNQAVLQGYDAVFRVDVSGTGPFSYEWRWNGTNLPSDLVLTVAGNGTTNGLGDGGLGNRASLNWPFGVTLDHSGNLLIADYGNNRVRRVDTNGIITTVAGNGTGAFAGDGGWATNASLSKPAGVVVDGLGNLYISDYSNHRIRKVDLSGVISTIVGDGQGAFAGDGGSALNASLNHPFGLAFDSVGNLFIVDHDNNCVRRVDTNGIITTVAGGSLVNPTGVALDRLGNLYIADCNCNRVVKVDTNGIMTLFAGTGSYIFSGDGGLAVNAGISYPRGVAVDAAGNVLIAVFYDNRIRKVDTHGIITTIAGNGDTVYSGDNISAANASFYYPQGIAIAPNGNLYIADYFHHRIREVAYAGPVLRLSNVSTNNAGNYSVVITNAYGSVTSSVAVLTVNMPVYMVTQPENRQVLAGSSAAFGVTCGGTPPLNYQWRFNGADLAGATETGYTVSLASTNDAGTYAVVVTNAYGAVTSSVAVLTVVLPPSISAQSGDQTAILGGVAMLSVAAAGPGPYSRPPAIT